MLESLLADHRAAQADLTRAKKGYTNMLALKESTKHDNKDKKCLEKLRHQMKEGLETLKTAHSEVRRGRDRLRDVLFVLSAYTLRDPRLAQATLEGVKDVENRRHVAPQGWYAVHVSKNLGKYEFTPQQENAMRDMRPWSPLEVEARRGCIVGVVYIRAIESTTSCWVDAAAGGYSHQLVKAVKVSALAADLYCRGQLGFWEMPENTQLGVNLDIAVASVVSKGEPVEPTVGPASQSDSGATTGGARLASKDHLPMDIKWDRRGFGSFKVQFPGCGQKREVFSVKEYGSERVALEAAVVWQKEAAKCEAELKWCNSNELKAKCKDLGLSYRRKKENLIAILFSNMSPARSMFVSCVRKGKAAKNK